MSKTVRYGLIVAACNSALLLLLVAFNGNGVLVLLLAMAFMVELIVAIVFQAISANTDLGSGLLLGMGLSLLIGLGVCGIMNS